MDGKIKVILGYIELEASLGYMKTISKEKHKSKGIWPLTQRLAPMVALDTEQGVMSDLGLGPVS